MSETPATRNRHCPKCQGIEQARWMEARAAESLPIPYFHVTFTLQKAIGPIALQNKRVVYDILFRAAAEKSQHLDAHLERCCLHEALFHPFYAIVMA